MKRPSLTQPVQYVLTFAELERLALFLAGTPTTHHGRDIYQWLSEENFDVEADDYPHEREYAQEAKEAYDDV